MYTKGKNGELWYVDNFVTSKGIFCDNSCFDGGRSVIAIMQKLLDGNDESNATLVAAAPDLLAALEGMVAVWDGPRDRAAVRFAQQVIIARAAIAKAKGLRVTQSTAKSSY